MSVHIGVNSPRAASPWDSRAPLTDSESAAWSMAELASQAGYGSILVLRDQMATLDAVNAVLWNASQRLESDDTLLVTFSGHGGQVPDLDGEDPLGSDESWSVYDGELLDDQLCGYWRLFRAGVRIVVVSESCYSGGMIRSANRYGHLPVARPGQRRARGEPDWVEAELASRVRPAAVVPSRNAAGVRASVLMLTASGETQPAQGGLFTHALVEAWAGGAFPGSYHALYEDVKTRVMKINSDQEPQLLVLGASDPGFLQAPAFRPDCGPARIGASRSRGIVD